MRISGRCAGFLFKLLAVFLLLWLVGALAVRGDDNPCPRGRCTPRTHCLCGGQYDKLQRFGPDSENNPEHPMYVCKIYCDPQGCCGCKKKGG